MSTKVARSVDHTPTYKNAHPAYGPSYKNRPSIKREAVTAHSILNQYGELLDALKARKLFPLEGVDAHKREECLKSALFLTETRDLPLLRQIVAIPHPEEVAFTCLTLFWRTVALNRERCIKALLASLPQTKGDCHELMRSSGDHALHQEHDVEKLISALPKQWSECDQEVARNVSQVKRQSSEMGNWLRKRHNAFEKRMLTAFKLSRLRHKMQAGISPRLIQKVEGLIGPAPQPLMAASTALARSVKRELQTGLQMVDSNRAWLSKALDEKNRGRFLDVGRIDLPASAAPTEFCLQKALRDDWSLRAQSIRDALHAIKKTSKRLPSADPSMSTADQVKLEEILDDATSVVHDQLLTIEELAGRADGNEWPLAYSQAAYLALGRIAVASLQSLEACLPIMKVGRHTLLSHVQSHHNFVRPVFYDHNPRTYLDCLASWFQKQGKPFLTVGEKEALLQFQNFLSFESRYGTQEGVLGYNLKTAQQLSDLKELLQDETHFASPALLKAAHALLGHNAPISKDAVEARIKRFVEDEVLERGSQVLRVVTLLLAQAGEATA